MSAPRPQNDRPHDGATHSPELRSLEDELRLLDQRLERIESSSYFRFMRFAGGIIGTQKRKAGQILRRSPLHWLYLRLRGSKQAAGGVRYAGWIAAQETRRPSLDWYRSEAAHWRLQPLISIVLPTFQPRREWLERAIASVKAQTYERWQLCICDDASGETWVREFLKAEASADPRIRLVFRETTGGISAGLNSAGKLATGEYVAFLDHDDELSPYALHYVAEACQDEDVDILYSDEDYLDPSGARCHPTFKPDWSPELLDCCMYFGHLFVARRSLVDDAGWFRSECDGAQDYDLALRLVEHARTVRHLRQVLYHWRQHPQSTSMNPKAKPYAHEAGRRAAADSVARRKISATVADGPIQYTFYLRRPVPSERVSLVVCSRDPRRLSAFLEGQKQTRHGSMEIVVVEHRTPGDERLSRLLDTLDCVRVPYEGAFNFSLMSNRGAEAARADLLVFINDDITPSRPEWLDAMAAQLVRPEIGVVGGRLLYPSGALQHAGLVYGILDGAGHPGRGAFYSELMYYLDLPRDVSAVTGACLGIRRSVFEELGGFDVSFPVNYGDLDLCLRAGELGYRNVVDPRIELTHIESATRRGGTTFDERQMLRKRWGKVLAEGDPFYPDVFDRTTEEVRLAI